MIRLLLIPAMVVTLCAVALAAPSGVPSGNPCTTTLQADEDLSAFLETLRPGDVGCLPGGEYTDGCNVRWETDATATTRATLRSTPGELAVLHTSLTVAGDNLTVSRIRVAEIDGSCGSDMSGFTVQGANDRIEYSSVYHVSRHGILTNTSSSNVTLHGNRIGSVGTECAFDHGIYFQTSGRITRNVISDMRCGYGIHLYAHPHDVVVAQNTVAGSSVRAGILVATDGDDITVASNIVVGNAGFGIDFRSCGQRCLVDGNLTWGNGSDPVGGLLATAATNTRNADPLFADGEYRVGPGSPAVDTASPDLAFSPDRDGQQLMGAGPDVGAYEYPGSEPSAYDAACAPSCDEQLQDLRTESATTVALLDRTSADLAAMTTSRDEWRARAQKAEDRLARIVALARE
jgi:hypothetical protein